MQSLLLNSLFKMDPMIKPIFGFNVEQVINGSHGLHRMAILIHGQNIIQMLNTMFSVLGPDMDLLQEVLADIGDKHCKLGLSPDHFMLLCRALLEVLSKAMGDDWTAELKTAWFQVIRFLSFEISKAMQKRILASCDPIYRSKPQCEKVHPQISTRSEESSRRRKQVAAHAC